MITDILSINDVLNIAGAFTLAMAGGGATYYLLSIGDHLRRRRRQRTSTRRNR